MVCRGCINRTLATAILNGVFGAFRCCGWVALVAPRREFADVCHFVEKTVEACFGDCASESGFMHAWAAGGDDYAVEFLLLDGFADFFLSRISAGVAVLFNEDNVWYGFGVFGDCMYVYCACDVKSAVANEDADSEFFRFGGLFGLLISFSSPQR